MERPIQTQNLPKLLTQTPGYIGLLCELAETEIQQNGYTRREEKEPIRKAYENLHSLTTLLKERENTPIKPSDKTIVYTLTSAWGTTLRSKISEAEIPYTYQLAIRRLEETPTAAQEQKKFMQEFLKQAGKNYSRVSHGATNFT